MQTLVTEKGAGGDIRVMPEILNITQVTTVLVFCPNWGGGGGGGAVDITASYSNDHSKLRLSIP